MAQVEVKTCEEHRELCLRTRKDDLKADQVHKRWILGILAAVLMILATTSLTFAISAKVNQAVMSKVQDIQEKSIDTNKAAITDITKQLHAFEVKVITTIREEMQRGD